MVGSTIATGIILSVVDTGGLTAGITELLVDEGGGGGGNDGGILMVNGCGVTILSGVIEINCNSKSKADGSKIKIEEIRKNVYKLLFV